MDKDSCISYWIDLPPTHKEVFGKIIEVNKIEEVKDIVALSEDEFKNIDGITPLMVTKTKEALQKYGFRFGMTIKDILDMEDERYFQHHRDEKEIAKGEQGLIKEYLDNAPEKPRFFTREILEAMNNIRNHEHQPAPEPIKADEDEDIYGIAENHEEPLSPENHDTIPNPEQTEEDMKEQKKAELEKIEAEIESVKKEEFELTSPLDDLTPNELEWLRTYAILDAIRYDPWYIKLFVPFTQRVDRAISNGNYLFKKWFENGEYRHFVNKPRREAISRRLKELYSKRSELRMMC